MVHTCVVSGCRNRRTPGTALSFYRFPRDPERKQRWVDAVNRQGWQPNDGSRLCSSHFISGKQVKNPRSPDYVPSLFSPPAPDMREPADMKEPEDSELRDKQQAQVEAANALLFLQGQGRDPIQTQTPKEDRPGPETPSSPPSADDGDNEEERDANFARGSKRGRVAVKEEESVGLEEALGALQNENQALREALEKMSLSESSLRNDPEKVRFYTGLPNYYVLETVMWLLAPHMDDTTKTSPKNPMRLSKFQQLLLTLVRLRLDLRHQDLAYRFGVRLGTVTRAVRRAVDVMSSTLVPTAVFWPSRAELRKNLPAAVRAAHPDCAVIIDFFTVSLERPPTAPHGERPGRAGPGGNTLKYLIGVAPQGVVTFVSGGVAGDVGDKTLVEGCGFLCKLLPGDVVLASHGLDIGESVAARGASFKIAGGGSERGSAHSLLGHVEKVIAMVRRRYAVLTGPVESCFASDRSAFDKVVQVACALNNLCISAAPLE
ncbi:uncharacterized protein LOC132448209 isoform X1 [Gadus macrocephalus]|uniref:uncharacterized protein LOC132448209 isoform X1 n=1 Tax=Gadus macrocephalus TaxID=80720 RepID=UPI0028CB429D|nr:uncharacterized protein LOC132448209 isoform X1 [Gadus macrocephalus]